MSAHATVLYDAPGPKTRRRSRIISIIGLVAVAGLLGWIVYRLSIPQVAVNGNETPAILDGSRWNVLDDVRVWRLLWTGARMTLLAAVAGMAGALILAVLLAFARLSHSPFVRIPTTIILEFFRGMPVLLMMLFILLVSSTGALSAVIIALIVYNGAILGEALRAGILSLDSGQREAGLSIGLTRTRTRLLIELPQAFTQMLPIIMAQLVVLLKDTSLGYSVGYGELLATVRNLSNFFGNAFSFTFWLIGAVAFLAINLLVSWIGRRAARVVAARRRG
jgi:glutamate transport system permease protein